MSARTFPPASTRKEQRALHASCECACVACSHAREKHLRTCARSSALLLVCLRPCLAHTFWFSITRRNSENSISPLLSSSTSEIMRKISSSVGF